MHGAELFSDFQESVKERCINIEEEHNGIFRRFNERR